MEGILLVPGLLSTILIFDYPKKAPDESLFYGPFGVKVGSAAGLGGVGFEPVLGIGSQRFDGAM